LVLSTTRLSAQSTIKIATSPSSSAILEFIKPKLAGKGIELTILVFNDYILPNKQVADKKIDANFVQHMPYLEQFNSDNQTNLVAIGDILIAPFGAYSYRINDIAELTDGAKVIVPHDEIHLARALLLLQKAELITLNDNSYKTNLSNIIGNHKNLILKQEDLSKKFIANLLQGNDLVLMNLRYALEIGLNPETDAIISEEKESPYVNVVVTHEDNQDLPELKILVEELKTDAVREFIRNYYKGHVIAVF